MEQSNGNVTVIDQTDQRGLDQLEIETVDYTRKEAILKTLNVNERTSIESFGNDIQEKVGDFTTSIFNQVRTKDAGTAGEALVELVSVLSEWDESIESTNPVLRFLSNLPVVKPLINKGKKVVTEFRTVEKNVENIKHDVSIRALGCDRENIALDVLFCKQVEYLGEMNDHLAAGYEKHNEIVSKEIPALQNLIGNSTANTMKNQKLRDVMEMAKFLEVRVFELALNRTSVMQSLDAIRLIQANNRALAQKMRSALTTMIPMWYTQTAIALCLSHQDKNAAVLKQMGDVTNGMMMKNADGLHRVSVNVAKETERPLIDTKTLKAVNAKLVSTINDMMTISKQGQESREKFKGELVAIEQQLYSASARLTQGIKQLTLPENLKVDVGTQVPKTLPATAAEHSPSYSYTINSKGETISDIEVG